MSTRAERKAVYGSRRWQALRARVLREAGYLCECPDCKGETGNAPRILGAELVHHVKPWQEGKTKEEREALAFDRANCLAVSRPCHAELHAAMLPQSQAVQQWAAFTAELMEVRP